MKSMYQKYQKAFHRSLLWIGFLCSFNSCDKFSPTVKAPTSYTDDNYSNTFEAFWNGMNTNYVFWDVDPTDWNQMYNTYKPLFAKMGPFNATNNILAENYFTEMTSNIIDSHYTLTFEKTG